MSLASKNFTKALILALLSVLLSASLFAQSTTDGAIGGTVADPQNLVVPGAVVTVHNNATDQDITVTTDNAGYYRVIHLQPTTYTVSVQAKGFAPSKVEQVIVTVGSLTNVSPKLTIGTTEQVNVSGEAPLVNVESADFAPVMNSTAIENLPINGGRWSSFTVLTPGVVSNSDGFGLLSFRGTSAILNNVTVDGADNNQAFFSEERGRTRAGYSTPKVAVQEFQVNTSNYSSEYGRSAGGVVNTVTKSGSNQLHGEAYWYDRDNDWGSTNPYSTLTSVTQSGNNYTATTSKYKAKDVRMMGGFGIGGPIIKDKLFWFLAYDKFHRNFPGFSVPNNAASFFAVPDGTTPMTSAGVATTCGGTGTAAPTSADYNVCTLAAELANHTGKPAATGTNSIASISNTAYASAATMWNNAMFGNTATGQLGLYSMNGTVPRKGDQGIWFPKVDWIVNQKNHAFFELNRMRWSSPGGVQTQATNAYGPSSFGNDYVKDTWGVAKLDTMVTTKLSNQLRFQYGRDFEYESDQKPNAYELQTLVNPNNIAPTTGALTPTGYTNPTGLPPNVYFSGYQWGTLYYTNRIKYPDEYKTQIADTVSYAWGRHNFKFGMDFQRTNDSMNNLYMQYGEYSFSGLNQYMAQLYDPAHAYFNDYYQGMQGGAYNNPAVTYKFSNSDIAFFAQDDWKLTRRLTVNLGLRYDTETLPSAYKGLAETITLGSQTLVTGQMPNRPNAFGPRVGFSWDTFGDAKTVLRGGYGIYFGRIVNGHIYSALTSTGNTDSPLSQINWDYYAGASGAALTNVFPQIYQTSAQITKGVAIKPSAAILDKNFTFPQIHEIDMSLQREIGWKTVVSVSYLGSLGRHLANFTDLNIAPAGSVPGVPSTITYTLSNLQSGNPVARMPLPNGATFTVPFYTSRLSSQYGAVIDDFSGANSNYNAMAIQIEKRMSDHVQFALNYTWSHALDTGVNGTTNFSGTTYSNVLDPINRKYGVYGNSGNDVPQRLTFNAVIESPWKHSSAWRYLLDGWQAAPVVQVQKGLNYSVTTTSSPTVTINGVKYGLSNGMLGAGGSLIIPGTRGQFHQPNTYISDLRLSKQFRITERYKAEFSADCFNVFNHNNITGVNTSASYAISGTSYNAATGALTSNLTPNSSAVSNGTALFGTATNGNSNYVYNPRQIQLGFRVSF
jgi:outer membrane receptor protein involved in Fe transport